MINFEWDKSKNKINIKKHEVSFEEASSVFNDMKIISIPDIEHSVRGEERWVSIGISYKMRTLVVIHLFLTDAEKQSIRIISARKATKMEIQQYESNTGL